MKFDAASARNRLKKFDLVNLFVEELGWNRISAQPLQVKIGADTYVLQPQAEKCDMVAYLCLSPNGSVPDYNIRRKVEKEASKTSRENIVVFADSAKRRQSWLWVKREAGQPDRGRRHDYDTSQSGEALVQKLQHLAITLEEEEKGLSIVQVAAGARRAFDLERVTKRFYIRFKEEHKAFLSFIKGIVDSEDQQWYASVMLNRLMFIYFIQKKGFLDGDVDYLRNRLASMRQRKGKDQFLTFYRHFLLRLFHEGLGARSHSAELDRLIGNVPYLNGGLFDLHELERANKDIQIADEAFERIFRFFDAYNWHLDERPLRADDEINPDVLGYIFEKYVNEEQMGAYYTKEDITGYISQNTIIPHLFDVSAKLCEVAFRRDGAVWGLLRENPDRYLYDAMKRGVIEGGKVLPAPPDVADGLSDISKREGWSRPASAEAALPTESWREYVERRERCLAVRKKLVTGEVTSIDDLIAHNLDIRQFAQDVIENSEGPELVRAFYDALCSISILDPTCGSGAFLFAALNVLEPLYDACLDRMQAFLDEPGAPGELQRPEKFQDFRNALDQIKQHANRRYFILKSIIIGNLYGVDIMEEAVEICKLRLFLKLVAQVESKEQIEPLPDIDFNVKSGNTLVGFATLDRVKATAAGTLGFAKDDVERIVSEAEAIDRRYKAFRLHQTGDASGDAQAEKAQLLGGLRDLRSKLDNYLSGDYGIKANDRTAFATWIGNYHPFHWFAEFYGILSGGGFDVIIGNPPYVELTALSKYSPLGYQCRDAGNLYALVMERCASLCSPQGRQGYIVPVSSVSTDRYQSLQKLLCKRRLFFSSFDDRPSRLFDGLEHIRLTIHLLGHVVDKAKMESTRYNKWNTSERATLFNQLRYAPSAQSLVEGTLPKFTSEIELGIVGKLKAQHSSLSLHYSRSGSNRIYYSRKVGYFLQILDFEPRVLDGSGNLRPPSEFKELRFGSKEKAELALACLNSSLFYWFITVYSDCRHVNKREVDAFPIDLDKLRAFSGSTKLRTQVQSLMADLKVNSVERVMRFKHDTLTVQCIIPKLSKPIIDDLDRTLAEYYGFTPEETDFIINYDLKYRIGQGGAEED